jgi:hypothetical protein
LEEHFQIGVRVTRDAVLVERDQGKELGS